MKFFAVLVTLLAVSFSSHALTLKEKKKLESARKDIAESSEMKFYVTNCGGPIPVTIDDSMATPFMEANVSIEGYCSVPLSTMGTMCKDATSKEAVLKSIKKYTCKFGKAKEVKFDITGSEFVMSVGPGASNLDDKAKDYLENKL